ncbi:3-dehydroquinate synthase [Labilibaculum euxinus]|uniref:3-dehydroquinate synthase n=1 Tax=Labilibaculum euxinus TaxID=2686357 RepID=A0A7M4D8G0_9BACT|nr:3-dehydroquinate synthase [Labilibaculum euxinus]MUP38939.1 3-dehydroquinate synthase [Labilibaculum euxinus]MVB08144.1 3-dehydroquinate synthase [Labilibaculum euxinus]
MKTIHIEKQNSSIFVGESYLNIKNYLPEKKCFLICDENIYRHYSEFINQFDYIVMGCGEGNKNWQTAEKIIDQLLERGADRNSFLLGMGGGLVSDVTGFVASIFMRGLEFGFISTSLLSQVDASVGGKNGINFGKLKNMIGIFNPPKFVICDPVLLKTLPKREVRSGFGEVIKHAFIKDEDLYNFLNDNCEALLNLDPNLMENLVYRAVSIKTEVVEGDPFEKGERKKLNFGHTIGHAIENNSDLTHGEAVSVGMNLACQLSQELCELSDIDAKRANDLLRKFELPLDHDVSADMINQYLIKDKKKNRSAIDFILLKKIGEATIVTLPIEELKTKVIALCANPN